MSRDRRRLPTKIIKLTRAKTVSEPVSKPAYIRISTISHFGEEQSGSRISLITRYYIDVLETPEEILQLMENPI